MSRLKNTVADIPEKRDATKKLDGNLYLAATAPDSRFRPTNKMEIKADPNTPPGMARYTQRAASALTKINAKRSLTAVSTNKTAATFEKLRVPCRYPRLTAATTPDIRTGVNNKSTRGSDTLKNADKNGAARTQMIEIKSVTIVAKTRTDRRKTELEFLLS